MDEAHPTSLAQSAASSRPATEVLVVDDERDIVDVILDVLDLEEIQADSCPYGDRVVACIQRKQPKVLLLDIQMPGLDGIEIFQRLRADPRTAGIYVIFVTANADRLLRWFPDYEALGAAVLPKPFVLDQLVDMVRQGLASAA